MEQIRPVDRDRKRYLPLLLEADPDEGMIDRYLEKGRMYVLEEDGSAVAVAVTVTLEDGVCELKNLAVVPERRNAGVGARLLRAVMAREAADCRRMYVGTARQAIPFYRRLGFTESHTVQNFFVDNYPEPIFEDGVQCVDMLYLRRDLRNPADF